MTGSALAGMLSVTFNVTAASIGIGGLPGILSIQPQYMLPFAGTMLVAIVVPMLLTFFFRKAGLFTKQRAIRTCRQNSLLKKKQNL